MKTAECPSLFCIKKTIRVFNQIDSSNSEQNQFSQFNKSSYELRSTYIPFNNHYTKKRHYWIRKLKAISKLWWLNHNFSLDLFLFILTRCTSNRNTFDIRVVWLLCNFLNLNLASNCHLCCHRINRSWHVASEIVLHSLIHSFAICSSSTHLHTHTCASHIRACTPSFNVQIEKISLVKNCETFHFAIWLFYFIFILEKDSFTLVCALRGIRNRLWWHDVKGRETFFGKFVCGFWVFENVFVCKFAVEWIHHCWHWWNLRMGFV